MVAYLLPGFIALAGLAPLFPVVRNWLRPMEQSAIGFGPTVYAVLSATAAGMIVSCFRWLLIDPLHYWTGTVPPRWDDERLDDNLAAFNYLVEAHYRFYQFYANTLVAIVWAYGINRLMRTSNLLGVGTDLAVFILCAVLFAGSRDALAKYYNRTRRLVGVIAEKDDLGIDMTNGNHQAEEARANANVPSKVGTKPKKLPKRDIRESSTRKAGK